jgi:uncharacterized membrane protein YccC
MGIQPSRWQLYFTVSTMVATVNSVVGGSVVALLAGRLLDAPLGAAAAVGALAAAASFALLRRWDRALHQRHGGYDQVLFPSP